MRSVCVMWVKPPPVILPGILAVSTGWSQPRKRTCSRFRTSGLVAALLAAMLSLGRMFGADFADGSLEQLVLAPQPLTALLLSKVAAHWLTTGLPLVLVAPVLGLQFDLPADALTTLLWSLLIGTPALSLSDVRESGCSAAAGPV